MISAEVEKYTNDLLKRKYKYLCKKDQNLSSFLKAKWKSTDTEMYLKFEFESVSQVSLSCRLIFKDLF